MLAIFSFLLLLSFFLLLLLVSCAPICCAFAAKGVEAALQMANWSHHAGITCKLWLTEGAAVGNSIRSRRLVAGQGECHVHGVCTPRPRARVSGRSSASENRRLPAPPLSRLEDRWARPRLRLLERRQGTATFIIIILR